MKIAVSAEGRNMSSVDPRFSRAKGFIIYDTGGSEPAYVDNEQNLESAHGAGVQSAVRVIDAVADVVITGNVGHSGPLNL